MANLTLDDQESSKLDGSVVVDETLWSHRPKRIIVDVNNEDNNEDEDAEDESEGEDAEDDIDM